MQSALNRAAFGGDGDGDTSSSSGGSSSRVAAGAGDGGRRAGRGTDRMSMGRSVQHSWSWTGRWGLRDAESGAVLVDRAAHADVLEYLWCVNKYTGCWDGGGE